MSGHLALDAPRSPTSFWLPLGIAAMCSLVTVLVLVLLLAPPLRSASEMRVSNGSTTFEIGAGAEVRPADGWSARPLAFADGLQVQSPDRLLRVTLTPAAGEAALSDRLGSADDEGLTMTETLENGLVVEHRTADDEFEALLRLERGTVLVHAEVDAVASIDTYRPALADLLLRISAAHG